MDTTTHNLTSLFAQLGLDNSPEAIELFITHHKLDPTLKLVQAPFWSPSQVAFINESLQQDANWSDVIAQLDALLR